MDSNLRKWGQWPFNVVLLHGGPGAAGELDFVAKELYPKFNILEPTQTKSSVDGQIEELKDVILQNSVTPVILVGYSWGAWLAVLFAARYPDLIKKVVLVSSGPFEDKYVPEIMQTRMSHLSEPERSRVIELQSLFNDPEIPDKNKLFAEFGALLDKADSFDEDQNIKAEIRLSIDIYNKVWPEASQMRKNGSLLELVRLIKCPVVAIHGDYDPHPANGVKEPLAKLLKDFKFILLEKCGHHPWKEKHARDKFFGILTKELGD